MSLSNSIFRSRNTLTEGNIYIATIKEEYRMSLSNSIFRSRDTLTEGNSYIATKGGVLDELVKQYI